MDKATFEVEAVEAGALGRILVPEGTEGVPFHTPIAELADNIEPDQGSTLPADRRQTPPEVAVSVAFTPAGDPISGQSRAMLEFSDGSVAILLAPGASGDTARLRVIRVSPSRYIVELADRDAPVVDGMTQALLTTLREQATRGQRPVLHAQAAQDAFQELTTGLQQALAARQNVR